MNIIVLNTIEKALMCGDVGFGAMQEPLQLRLIVHSLIPMQ